MGALASREQLDSVREAVAELAKSARIVAGDPDRSPVAGNGAFISPILLRSDDPWGAPAIHDVEAFGPVSTIMPYRDLDDAIALANRGMGSLALSLFTFDPAGRRGVRARRRRLSRPDGDPRPDLGEGIDRPRLAPPRPRPWRPRPRRRRRGDGRDPRRHPLHAAHRAPGQPGHARRDRPAMAAGRGQDRGRRPPVPQAHLRARRSATR